MFQMISEYALVYCSSHFLRAIGEPPAPLNPDRIRERTKFATEGSQDLLPVWIMFLFCLLTCVRYICSFLLHYIYEVICTVSIVSTVPVASYAAATARAHPNSKAFIDRKSAKPRQIFNRSRVNRQDSLLRSPQSRIRTAKHSVQSLSTRILNRPCLRGINAYLVMSVCQWYFPVIVDFVLSGQPDGLQLGYGSSSVVVAICFGGGAALWTHCAITERSSDYVYDHSEKGHQVLPKLVPVTAMWAFCEQISLSLPLALSRYYGLKKYAFEPQSWSQLGKYGQLLVMYQFFIVYSLHLALVAAAYVPANMILRRVHAGMLASDETAIVPVHHSEQDVSIAEAWSTMDWSAYWRVIEIYVQEYLLDHLIHIVYWSAVWMLYKILEIDRYQAQQLPNAPAMIHIRIV